MTLQECYERLHGDYNDVRTRLPSDRLVEKFMLKFPADNSFQILRDAIAAGDIENSFRGAHTLKGVAANLGFRELQTRASDLTEQLRPCTAPADPALFAAVQESYNEVLDTIAAYQNQQ